MKTYRYLISAALVLLGFTACQKGVMPQPQEDGTGTLVEVTVGADFVTTKTTMGDNGDVLWSAGDSIAVTVGENNYKFAIVSGAGTTSARFAGAVTEADAAILKGTATGTVTAYYPTSGTSVPTTQTYAEGTFADGMNPMTATFDKATKTLTFTNNAAVVRIKGVSKSAASAALTYTVGEQNHTVTMALTTGETAKDLYFVVVPGTKDFQFSLDGASAVDYETSAVTEAGKRYDLDKAATWVGSETALKDAINNAGSGTIIKLTNNITANQQLRIENSNSITINLNGKTLKGGQMDNPFVVTSNADVTFTNGNIIDGSYTSSGGCVAINGTAKFIDVNVESSCVPIYVSQSSANVTINGGVYKAKRNVGNSADQINNRCYCAPVCVMYGATVSISGGTFTGNFYACSIFNTGGTINISGGIFNKGNTQTETNEGNLAYAFFNDGNKTETKGTINISGNPVIHGSFRGRVNNLPEQYGYLNISGGTFDSDCILFNFDENKISLNGYTKTYIRDCPIKPGFKQCGKIWQLEKKKN